MNRIIAWILLLGLVISYAAAQGPQMSPPPLVPCEDAAEGVPCVVIVTELSEVVGTWRRYYQGANAMGYSEFRSDGTVTIGPDLQAGLQATATISIDDGVAAIAANPGGPAPPECVTPGLYEMRLFRVGDRPVALSFHLMAESDPCAFRVGDFSMPMIYYGGSGAELAMDPGVAALAQSLVPCPDEVDEPYPCAVVATRAEDASGIWKQYVGRPDLQAPGGMGFQRIDRDGRFFLADSPENTAMIFRNYPYGTMVFEDGEVQITVASVVPPGCETAIHRFHVYRYGTQPVALRIAPIEDACAPRVRDMGQPIVWVADAN
jgi:hypothetical protein